jgi:NAD(P)H dehydrogenase (quinone)
VAAALERLAPEQIVVTSRTPESLADIAERGVAVRFADFNSPDTLQDAFRGVDRLLMVSASNATGKRHDQHSTAVDAAKSAGVSRIGFTSMPNVDRPGHPSGLAAQEYRDAEVVIEASGLEYVLLRVAPYTELNAVERMLTAVRTGVLRMNTGAGRVAFISRADVGASVVAALLSEDFTADIVDITGSALHTFADVVTEVSAVVGKTIRYDVIGDDEYRADLLAAGDSELLAEAVAGLGKAIRTGYFEVRTDHAAKLLGREPRALADVVADNAHALRANLGE